MRGRLPRVRLGASKPAQHLVVAARPNAILCRRFSHFSVVLVAPESPANVGSVARVCSNFGVEQLWVSPFDGFDPTLGTLPRHELSFGQSSSVPDVLFQIESRNASSWLPECAAQAVYGVPPAPPTNQGFAHKATEERTKFVTIRVPFPVQASHSVDLSSPPSLSDAYRYTAFLFPLGTPLRAFLTAATAHAKRLYARRERPKSLSKSSREHSLLYFEDCSLLGLELVSSDGDVVADESPLELAFREGGRLRMRLSVSLLRRANDEREGEVKVRENPGREELSFCLRERMGNSYSSTKSARDGAARRREGGDLSIGDASFWLATNAPSKQLLRDKRSFQCLTELRPCFDLVVGAVGSNPSSMARFPWELAHEIWHASYSSSSTLSSPTAISDSSDNLGPLSPPDSLPWRYEAGAGDSKGSSGRRRRKIALVFGREKSGLTAKEMAECDYLLTIPRPSSSFSSSTSHSTSSPPSGPRGQTPSLNLSHAVAVVLYELTRSRPSFPSSQTNRRQLRPPWAKPVEHNQMPTADGEKGDWSNGSLEAGCDVDLKTTYASPKQVANLTSQVEHLSELVLGDPRSQTLTSLWRRAALSKTEHRALSRLFNAAARTLAGNIPSSEGQQQGGGELQAPSHTKHP